MGTSSLRSVVLIDEGFRLNRICSRLDREKGLAKKGIRILLDYLLGKIELIRDLQVRVSPGGIGIGRSTTWVQISARDRSKMAANECDARSD